MSVYARLLTSLLEEAGRPELDVRHVEAWIRLEHPTLNGLTRGDFAHEVAIAITCIDIQGTQVSETLAFSYGLKEGA